jgi:hypothetical protein
VSTHGKRTQQQASKLLSDADTRVGATKTPGGNGFAPLANGVRPVVEPPVLGSLEHTDYYMLNELLTDDQRALKARIRSFMDTDPLMTNASPLLEGVHVVDLASFIAGPAAVSCKHSTKSPEIRSSLPTRYWYGSTTAGRSHT